MKKLEEYRNSLSDPESDGSNYDSGVKRGFDAAIALNLPVKFANWKDEECYYNIKGWMMYDDESGIEFQDDELYQYWIENVFKP